MEIGRLAGELVSASASTSLASQHVRQVLLALQVSATIVVLVSAGLFVRAVIHGFGSAAGFDVDRTAFVSIQEGTPWGTGTGYRPDLITQRTARLMESLREVQPRKAATMNGVRRRAAMALLGAWLVVPAPNEAQREPDFTGTWVLVEALAGGPARDAAGNTASEGPRRTSSTTVSGAPFNCGRGCTITQREQTLTIEHAQLADYPGKDKSRPTPTVTLRLDGRDAQVVDSFSPPGQLPANARWDGNKVRIESRRPGSAAATTQLLSLEGGQLVVVTSVTFGGESKVETTYEYDRRGQGFGPAGGGRVPLTPGGARLWDRPGRHGATARRRRQSR